MASEMVEGPVMPDTVVTPIFGNITAAETPSLGALSAEADHRIANNLTMIAGLVRLHRRGLPNDRAMSAHEVGELLDEISARIQTVGQLHKLLASAGQPGAVDIAEYLREIAEMSLSTLSAGERASLSLTLEPGCTMPARQAVAAGLIASEALTNALKYAHPTGVHGKIQVACRQRNGRVIVEVADDGVGLPESFDRHQDGAVGFLLMRSLASQLGADLEFDQRDIGICVRLSVPVTAD